MALSMLPSMRKYGDCVYNRYQGSVPEYNRDYEKEELVKLARDGLSREIEGITELSWEIKEIRELLVEHAFIRQPPGEREYFLTEKGKELVRAIIAEVVREEPGAQGEESAKVLPLLP